MKHILFIITLLAVNLTFGQSGIPDFLHGTWKMENEDVYEHWDKLNSRILKGFSYKIKNGQIEISEYLDISEKNNQTIYTAAVINQNNGKGIEFKLTKADSTFTFENPDHDFPKKISYQKLSDNEIFIQISDGNQKSFSFKMIKQNIKDTTIANPNYDKSLADKLGSDDYGMKSYFLVILKTGTNEITDKGIISESFRGHLNNINRLVEDGKMIVAGPFGKNKNDYRGIFILTNINTVDEAKELLQTDLAIKNGLLDFDIYNWYGSAALSEYLPFSDKVWKLKP
ncbi:MAG: DUF6265 family protein [Ignavibacteriaceae bacterium]|jgi:hypothetical protein|nr:DUF6265 family protein [Ignavibacteriaceae bacterium]